MSAEVTHKFGVQKIKWWEIGDQGESEPESGKVAAFVLFSLASSVGWSHLGDEGHLETINGVKVKENLYWVTCLVSKNSRCLINGSHYTFYLFFSPQRL